MNFINKINKYLLEQYPLIWNTRLVWMLGVNTIVHLLFFIIGFYSVNGLEDLKIEHGLDNYFFDTSNVYYNVLISIFILLIWIIYYLRNNAFKNLYSVKKGMLFKQFCIVLLIFFISTTQYFSFKTGLKAKIKSLYSWHKVDADIKTFNKANLFLMQNEDDYEIDKKQYPEPFPLKVAINYNNALEENIDTTKIYLKHDGSFLQFYKLRSDSVIQELNTYTQRYSNHNFKNRIVKDISAFKVFLNPSLLNYSTVKYDYGQDVISSRSLLNYYQNTLQNKDDAAIKEVLKATLSLAKKYNIKHNLTVENWFPLIDNKPYYLLKTLINNSDPSEEDISGMIYKGDENERNSSIPYSKNLYLDFNNLDNFFNNVHEAYFDEFNNGLFNFFIIFSIFLAVLIFVFKTTNLKAVLLSFVASLVVLVLIVWLMSSVRNLFENSKYTEHVIMISVSFVIILFSIISYVLKWKKIIISIFWSLVLFAIPTFFFFIATCYSKYLQVVYLELHPNNYSYKSDFEIWFDSYGFWVIILIWILTIYIYAFYIRKLKARAS